MQSWNITVNGEAHEIVFERYRLAAGRAELRIDGESGISLLPLIVKKVGMFYPFEVGDSELILKLTLNGKPAGLAQDGVYLDTGLPLEQAAARAFAEASQGQSPAAGQDRGGMGSFLTVVVLTFVNLGLTLINASVSFPFSAMTPSIIAAFAVYSYWQTGSVGTLVFGVGAALIFAAAYAVLWFLARSRTWPVMAALVLMVLDTAVLLFFAMDDFAYYIVDLAFHGWVVWSLARLWNLRRKSAAEEEAPAV